MNDRTATRLAWGLWSIGAAGFLAFVVIELAGAPSSTADAWFNAQEAVGALVYPTVGAVVASRRKDNAIGWLFLALGVSFALSAVGGAVNDTTAASSLAWQWGQWLLTWSWVPGWVIMVTFLLLLFPDGRLPSKRWRWLGWLAGAGIALSAFAGMTDPTAGGTPGYHSPLPTAPANVADVLIVAGSLCFLIAMVGSVSALIVRFRRSSGDERLQMKWFVVAGIATVVLIPARTVLATEVPALLVVGLASIPILPVATGIAILKYRLYEIDVVISKAVVYGGLAAFITVVYVAVMVGIGTVIGHRGGANVPLSIVATAIVAVAFQPVRTRVQRIANRVVYGERATPYEVLSSFSERMAETYSTEDVLPRMAEILGEGTGAERADVWLRVGSSLRPAATWPIGQMTDQELALAGDAVPHLDASAAVEVRDKGELLGALSVTMPDSDPMNPAKAALVADLASQAGLVLRNVRLIEELRASRQRLVAAQDEERRRLERNIHDGAQQQLVALAVKQRLLGTMIGRDDTRARELVTQLGQDTNDAMENLRDLARGIYPPLLADKGLAAALEAQARKATVPTSVEAEGIGRFSQDVEAAVYFSCLEALQNVAKYASATRADIVLMNIDHRLAFRVTDDGVGFADADLTYGTGLQGVADRLAALGGTLEVRSAPGRGTRIAGELPASTRSDLDGGGH